MILQKKECIECTKGIYYIALSEKLALGMQPSQWRSQLD
jgi:hypothetical protein